jgi:agmatine deiminase
MVLEGGSIDVDGEGTLLTTEECLLSKTQERNAGLTAADYEQAFQQALGISQVIWLNRGIIGDDTHGHVDDIARFVAPGRVVAALEEDKSDPNHELLKENYQRLKGAKDARGRALEVIKLPMPEPVLYEGERLPASYCNFYIANRSVLVPTFNAPQDRVVLNLLAELFPDREVIGIQAVDLILGLGTLHCLTQQQPS